MRQTARFSAWLSRRLWPGVADKTRILWADKRGAAAIEFGIFSVLLSAALANVTDVSIYIYQRMQVENATEVAAQAALKACSAKLPATTNCSSLLSAVQSALQSTSLGTAVALQSGSPTEQYYCINSSSALQYVSDVSSKPADCTAAGMPALQPGDYIIVNTTFSYQPLFGRLSVASTFPTPINRSAMLRLG